jgi:hypothetical protein
MLTAYFDETNTHSSGEIVIIAGFVMTSERWNAATSENCTSVIIKLPRSHVFLVRHGPADESLRLLSALSSESLQQHRRTDSEQPETLDRSLQLRATSYVAAPRHSRFTGRHEGSSGALFATSSRSIVCRSSRINPWWAASRMFAGARRRVSELLRTTGGAIAAIAELRKKARVSSFATGEVRYPC